MDIKELRDLMNDDTSLLDIILERLDVTKKERDTYTDQANRIVAAYNGSISALEEVLELYNNPPANNEDIEGNIGNEEHSRTMEPEKETTGE